jgi:hypothetical protein
MGIARIKSHAICNVRVIGIYSAISLPQAVLTG